MQSVPKTASPAATWWLLLAVVLVTAAAFAPAIRNGFTNWDDPGYVLDNPLLRDLSPGGLRAIATTFVEGNYHPLTIWSLALDYRSGKLNPAGYHRTNVVLHVLATAAVFLLILLLTGSGPTAAIASLFFGVHPLHVESVAWVSARKDVLYALFYFAACAAYVVWARKGARAAYAAALALFALSLLSKGMAVALPPTLVAIDFYLRRPLQVKTILVEKAPFWILAVAFGALAVVAQQSKGAVQEFATFPFYERIFIACYGLVAYVERALVPVHLSAFYPYPTVPEGGSLPVAYYLAPLGVAILAGAVVSSLKAGRTVAFSGLFFLINVALVLQLVPVGSAAMADRYTYVPYVGLGLALAWGYEALRARGSGAGGAVGRAVPLALLAAFFIGLLVATRMRIDVWRDNLTLWNDVQTRYPNHPKPYTQRAWSYHVRGEDDRAMTDVQKALSLDPNDGEALSTRGTLYYLSGDYTRAVADLNRAVRLRPRSASAWNNRGAALLGLERTDEAIPDFDKAIALSPSYTQAYLNRGLAFGVKREFPRVIADLDRAIALDPGNAQAYLWRGAARAETGDPAGGIRDYDEALRLSPRFAQAYFARALALEKLGRREDALRDALRAREAGYPVGDAVIQRLHGG
jgi:tetratricopeptide (TPR) repeat protein